MKKGEWEEVIDKIIFILIACLTIANSIAIITIMKDLVRVESLVYMIGNIVVNIAKFFYKI